MKPLLIVILLLSLAAVASCGQVNYSNVLVTRIIDGDTIELTGGERVRLIGIDTPEMYESKKLYRDAQRSTQDIKTIQEMGRKANEFTRKLVEGKQVQLEFDLEKKDKYGRLLAYVWYEIAPDSHIQDIRIAPYLEIDYRKTQQGHTGTLVFLNASIVKAGYANLLTIPPNVKYAGLFEQLYQQAREDHRGLWK